MMEKHISSFENVNVPSWSILCIPGAVLTLERSSYVAREGEMFLVRVLRSVDATEEVNLIVTAVDGSAEGTLVLVQQDS